MRRTIALTAFALAAFGTSLSMAFDGQQFRQLLTTKICENCDLGGADLRGANLRGADLTNAILYSANLRGADLTGAILCQTLMPEGKYKNSGC